MSLIENVFNNLQQNRCYGDSPIACGISFFSFLVNWGDESAFKYWRYLLCIEYVVHQVQ